MNRKSFLLLSVLLLALALATLWLITMAQPALERTPTNPEIAPRVPAQPVRAPVAPTGQTAPRNPTAPLQMARLQPEAQPAPAPENISLAGASPAAPRTWRTAPPAALGGLMLLAATGFLLLPAAGISSGSPNVRGA